MRLSWRRHQFLGCKVPFQTKSIWNFIKSQWKTEEKKLFKVQFSTRIEITWKATDIAMLVGSLKYRQHQQNFLWMTFTCNLVHIVVHTINQLSKFNSLIFLVFVCACFFPYSERKVYHTVFECREVESEPNEESHVKDITLW